MKSYYKLVLGRAHRHAKDCYNGSFVGITGPDIDLSDKLHEDLKTFNDEFIPLFQKNNPNKNIENAEISCATTWTLSKKMQKGDILLCPNLEGSYYVGKINQNYSYHPGGDLTHRRGIMWSAKTISQTEMSNALLKIVKSIGTIRILTKFANEIDRLLKG